MTINRATPHVECEWTTGVGSYPTRPWAWEIHSHSHPERCYVKIAFLATPSPKQSVEHTNALATADAFMPPRCLHGVESGKLPADWLSTWKSLEYSQEQRRVSATNALMRSGTVSHPPSQMKYCSGPAWPAHESCRKWRSKTNRMTSNCSVLSLSNRSWMRWMGGRADRSLFSQGMWENSSTPKRVIVLPH